VTGAENSALMTGVQNADKYVGQYAPADRQLCHVDAERRRRDRSGRRGQQELSGLLQGHQPAGLNTNYNPYDTPGFKDAINTATSDITNGVNGSFAAAGRDFSGANSMALGRGLTQGLAPTIAAQYNQNVNNQQGAAGNLYNAGNTNAGILAGLQQQKVANQGAGVGASQAALSAQNTGANATLQAEAARRGIPVQALGLLAQIGIPIGGLGGQSTGTSTGTQQMSGAQQFGQASRSISKRTRTSRRLVRSKQTSTSARKRPDRPNWPNLGLNHIPKHRRRRESPRNASACTMHSRRPRKASRRAPPQKCASRQSDI
jgi:hypothetical protein